VWRWPFRGPNCAFCDCSFIHNSLDPYRTVHINLEARRHIVIRANLPQHSRRQQPRTRLAHVTFHSHHSTTRLAPAVKSTLTQRIKRRACHSHPPRLAACHPWTALSAKHCPRLHKLHKRPPNESLPCCADIFVWLTTLRYQQKTQLPPPHSKHKTNDEISSPPSTSHTRDLLPPYPATLTSGLPITNSVLCVDRAHPTVGLLLAGYSGRTEVAA
jgi:hypothetical protein